MRETPKRMLTEAERAAAMTSMWDAVQRAIKARAVERSAGWIMAGILAGLAIQLAARWGWLP